MKRAIKRARTPVLSGHDVVGRLLKSAFTAATVLMLTMVARAQNSQFTFDPTGNLGTQASEIVALPQILGQPQNQIVMPGESATFSVVVADTRGVTYQWYSNSVAIPGATGDALLLANVGTNDAGPFSVRVSNTSGPVPSNPAFLYIDSDGDGLPDSWEMAHFGNLNQTATGDPDGDGVDNLQEYLDGTDPTNAASALYRITLLNDGGKVVVVPDQAAYTTGQMVTLTATGTNLVPFHAWTGNVVTRSNSITVTMTTNLNLFAHFLPFMFTWTNVVAGDWSVGANWTPNLPPASNENVVITVPALVTLNNNVDLLDFFLGGANVGPELTGTGRLTIAGAGTWLGGTMSGSGQTVIKPGATLTIAGFTGYGGVYLTDRTLENGGTTVWGGGNLDMSGVITNDAGASFLIQNAAAFNYEGGTPEFDNSGTFLATNGTSAFNGIIFNNYGAAGIQGGTLYLSGGGVHAGTVTVPAGAALNYGGGTFTGTPGSSITGAGMLQVSGGTVNLAGTVHVTGPNSFSNGTANLTGNYTCINNTLLDISGGTVNFDGTGTVAPLTLNLYGILGGAQTVTVGSVMNWTGGTMDGSGKTIIQPAATLTIAGFTGYGGVYLTGRTLENNGTVVWGGGNLGMSGCVITNDAGASFQIQNAAAFNYQGGTPEFDNSGTFLPTGAAANSFNGITFNNLGAINLAAGGTLSLGGGGLQTGTVTVPAGATLDYAGGTFTATGGSSITGAGALQVSGGTANLAGTVNVTGTNSFSNGTANLTGNYTCIGNTLLDISGGTVNFDGTGTVAPTTLNLYGVLGGANTVTVGGALNWTGGTMDGSGKTVIQPGATLTIAGFTGYGGVYLTDRTLENKGTAVWGGGNLGMTGVITNDAGASFQIHNTAEFNFEGGAPRFDNAGTFTTPGSGVTSFNGIALNNFNTVAIPGGILYANGGYVCSSSSLLNCALWGTVPGASFGQLQAYGTVNVAGTLKVYLTNYYVPKTNDSFAVLTAASVNGAFAAFIYPSNHLSLSLSNAPAAEIVRVTGVSLQQSNSLPAPPGMISWWRGENNATDSVGTNNGTLTNGVTYASGEVGQSFLLDGSSGCVYIPDSTSLRPASVTVEAWVKIFSTNGIQLVFAKPLGTNTLDSYGLAIQNGEALAAICDTGGFGVFLSDTNVLTLGQWHHLAFTFDATTGWQALYTDGAAVASGNAGVSMDFDNHPLLLGADIENTVPSYFLNGQIDEASIYNRALTADEIGSIYNVGAGGKQAVTVIPPPILYIQLITPASARIYWSTNYPAYHLEYNTGLNSPDWAASALTPVVTGTNFVATNSLAGPREFYRLSQAPPPFSPVPPALQIQLISSGMIRLLWPVTNNTAFLLQSSTNLTSPNWASVLPLPVIVGSNNVVTNAIIGSRQFFRLVDP